MIQRLASSKVLMGLAMASIAVLAVSKFIDIEIAVEVLQR